MLLALPLGELSPQVTERAHALAPVAKSIKCNDAVSGIAQRRPLGGAGERCEPEGVPPPKALRIGGGCAIIYYIHYRALRKEP